MASYKFSRSSLEKLNGCDPLLRKLMIAAIESEQCPVDFAVTCGQRGEKEQNEAYAKGNSKLRYPKSKHNKLPAMAVDVVPCPKGTPDWSDITNFIMLGNHIKQVAKQLGVLEKISWGGDWNSFRDYPHWEIK